MKNKISNKIKSSRDVIHEVHGQDCWATAIGHVTGAEFVGVSAAALVGCSGSVGELVSVGLEGEAFCPAILASQPRFGFGSIAADTVGFIPEGTGWLARGCGPGAALPPNTGMIGCAGGVPGALTVGGCATGTDKSAV